MRKQPRRPTDYSRAAYRTFIALAAAGVVVAWGGGKALAADSTAVRLNIVPTVCVVDVVQDGAGQTLQTPSDDCDSILPNLLTPVFDQAPASQQPALSALPFAGADAVTTQLVAHPRFSQGSVWAPVASTDPAASRVSQHDTRAATVLAAGIGAAAVATALGVDVALFEMHYSKTAARLIRTRATFRLFR